MKTNKDESQYKELSAYCVLALYCLYIFEFISGGLGSLWLTAINAYFPPADNVSESLLYPILVIYEWLFVEMFVPVLNIASWSLIGLLPLGYYRFKELTVNQSSSVGINGNDI